MHLQLLICLTDKSRIYTNQQNQSTVHVLDSQQSIEGYWPEELTPHYNHSITFTLCHTPPAGPNSTLCRLQQKLLSFDFFSMRVTGVEGKMYHLEMFESIRLCLAFLRNHVCIYM